jgi:hypothetical protein
MGTSAASVITQSEFSSKGMNCSGMTAARRACRALCSMKEATDRFIKTTAFIFSATGM